MSRWVRASFVLAIVFGAFCLFAALVSPVPGILGVTGYAAVALGIRKRRPAAALACSANQVAGVVVALKGMLEPPRDSGRIAIAVAAILALLFAWVFLRAWTEMRHDPARSGPDWPWYTAVAAVVLALILYQPFVMPSASMEKTVLIGDRFFVDRMHTWLGREPRRDEIVAFRYPLDHSEDYIKRVAGIPGDRLRLVHKQLYRNGALVVEHYAIHISSMEDSYRDNFPSTPNAPLQEPAMRMLTDAVSHGEVVVPQGKFFVLGDNRDDSSDSRYWGFVDRSELIGRPVLIYDSHPGSEPATAFNTRWNRLFKVL